VGHKSYRGEAAKKLAERPQKPKPSADSKKFAGSNKHMDGRGQSGQPKRK
jgi:hypothetical protein